MFFSLNLLTCEDARGLTLLLRTPAKISIGAQTMRRLYLER
jgi:hypothetical protein